MSDEGTAVAEPAQPSESPSESGATAAPANDVKASTDAAIAEVHRLTLGKGAAKPAPSAPAAGQEAEKAGDDAKDAKPEKDGDQEADKEGKARLTAKRLRMAKDMGIPEEEVAEYTPDQMKFMEAMHKRHSQAMSKKGEEEKGYKARIAELEERVGQGQVEPAEKPAKKADERPADDLALEPFTEDDWGTDRGLKIIQALQQREAKSQAREKAQERGQALDRLYSSLDATDSEHLG